MKLKKYINTILQLLVLITLLSCGGDDDSSESNLAPKLFDLLTVQNNTTDTTVLPVFTWDTSVDPDGDAVSYNFIIDTNPNPSTVLASDLTETSFVTTSRFLASKTYFWKVIAKDGKGGQTESETFTFSTRSLRIEKLTNNASFSPRNIHTSVVFKDKVWVIGGREASGELNDVWNSDDGITWNEVTSSASFSKRENHASVVFNNKIWVIGGLDLNGILKRDVWNSDDGITWSEVTNNAPFSSRAAHTATIFNNKIWIIGGTGGISGTFNDVWSSNDGINWTEETSNASFPPMLNHTVTVFNSKMWLVSGNDVWNSNDGIAWTQVANPFSSRTKHTSVVFDDAIFVIAGNSESIYSNDIKKSKDGIIWETVVNSTNNGLLFPKRIEHTSVVFNNQLLIIEGYNGGLVFLKDVWAIE